MCGMTGEALQLPRLTLWSGGISVLDPSSRPILGTRPEQGY
jgi:hypothetical protein